MSHTDPTFAIPVGIVFAVGGVLLVIDPERFLDLRGWPRTLDRFFGRRAATVVLRLSGGFFAAVTIWLVLHEAIAMIG